MFYLSEQSRNKYSEIIQRWNPQNPAGSSLELLGQLKNSDKVYQVGLSPWIPLLENIQFDT